MNLNFHQTFRPEKKNITEILLLARRETELSVEEISFATGIPTGASSGKVVPALEYARYMGLINLEMKSGKCKFSLTELGELVLEEDISLSEKITELLLHAMIVRNEKGADLWNFCFSKYQNKYSHESKYSLFENEVNDYFVSKVNTSPLASSYDDFFMNLNVLTLDKKNDAITFNDLGIDNQFEYLYAYVLMEYWDIAFPNQNEISSNEFEKLGFGNTFCWSKKEELEVLQNLADEGIIRLNKQLVPYTILRLVEKDELLEDIYSNLY